MTGPPPKSQRLSSPAESGLIKIDFRFQDEELTREAVIKNFFTTAAYGRSYSTRFYDADSFISASYRGLAMEHETERLLGEVIGAGGR